MLDIKFIRENREVIKEASRKKCLDFNIDELIEIDEKRREILQKVENLRAEQNEANEKVKNLAGTPEKESIIIEMKKVKDQLQKDESELKEIMDRWKSLMVKVPNIPDMSVPEGKNEDDNQELKQVGQKPQFSFVPKDHVELMTDLDLADFERGVKTHGFRGYFLKNQGARLSFALWNYGMDFFLKKGFQLFLPPAIVKKEYFYGTGHLPNEAEDLYVTQDDDYLSGTGEVSMMAYHADEILKKENLPLRYLAFSPCYRREAGSYGKDTKGLLRVHEFYKLEQLVLGPADHQSSVDLHEELQRNHEEFLESLGLPYRQILISSGDLSASKVKQYDTDLWIPSQKVYREIGSASYYHDFQCRRFNIKYRDGDQTLYAHSLNATAIPTPRSLISLLECNQQEDGSVIIPEVLRPYMGGEDKIHRL